MDETTALNKMIAPGMRRPGKVNGGTVQILLTSSCNLSCFSCTQASNVRRKPWFMSLEHFEQAVGSLRSYWGTIGIFGGCPTMHPKFDAICEILRRYVPQARCGLWTNNLMGHGSVCRITFNGAVSNLNVHLDRAAYDEMKQTWPEARPFGLDQDSRHSPPWVAMKDVLRKACPHCGGHGKYFICKRLECEHQEGVTEEHNPCELCSGSGQVYDETRAWELISRCDVNQHWSALIGVFRGELRAWFCEIAGAQSILHQDDPDYPDTGIDPVGLHFLYDCDPTSIHFGEPLDRGPVPWWQLPMSQFARQVRHHCHSCGVPLRGYGALAQADDGVEQTSATHADVYHPKRKGRQVEVVTELVQLGMGRIQRSTDYLGNAGK